MSKRLLSSWPAALLAGALLMACTSNTPPGAHPADQPAALAAPVAPAAAHPPGTLTAVYQGDTPWVGIVVSAAGRAFVLYPRPAGEAGLRVAELQHGQPVAYPSAAWQDWQPGAAPARKFVRVNALRINPDGLLWVVDTGTARMESTILPGGPKLVALDLATNQVARTIPLAGLLKPTRYVDDLRMLGNTLYLTDAGAPALVVLDKTTGRGRRVLENDTGTTDRRPLRAEGVPLTKPDGQPVRIHADQLEVSPDGQYLYFQPSSGPRYRVETRYLNDPPLSAAALRQRGQLFFDTPTTGGPAIDAGGNRYVTDANKKRLLRLTPRAQATPLVQDERRRWPAALWLDNHGPLWLPCAQLNRVPSLHGGKNAVKLPVFIYKLPLGVKPFRS